MDSIRRPDIGVRSLLIAASLVIVVAGLREAQALIVPVLASAMIAILFLPAMMWLQSKKVPDGLAVGLVLIGVLGVFGLISVGVGRSIAEFNNNLPKYEEGLSEHYGGLIDDVQAQLDKFDLQIPGLERDPPVTADAVNGGDAPVPSPGSETEAADATQTAPQDAASHPATELFDPRVILRYFGSVAGATAELLSNTFLIILTVAFILGEAAGFPRKLVQAFGGKDIVEGDSRLAVASVREYLRIKSELSLATGSLAGLGCAVLGIDFPILWGSVAFVLNFVPNVGSIIAAAPPILLAFVQPELGWEYAVAIAAVYAVINTVFGNIVEPRMMGRKLGLSSLVVWLSLVFWGWVWGPVGMLLSVPLTMLLKLFLERSDELRWVAVLLGPADETAAPAVVGGAQAATEYGAVDEPPPPADGADGAADPRSG